MSLPDDDRAAGTAGRQASVPDEPSRERPDLAPMNEEINALAARRGDRTVEDLVPEVEAIMNRYGVLPPGRDGVVQWISEAVAAARARD